MTFNRKSRGGQGGRGRSFYLKQTNNEKVTGDKKKKTLTDYTFYLGSAKQASDYEITVEYVINHIKKTYEFGNDIGTALKKLEPVTKLFTKPSLSMSTE